MSDFYDGGGPAFPSVGARWEGPGMELRDYFAAKAMQAMVGHYVKIMRGIDNAQCESDSDVSSTCRDMLIDWNAVTGEPDGAVEIANDAYTIANAMLAARIRPADEKGGGE